VVVDQIGGRQAAGGSPSESSVPSPAMMMTEPSENPPNMQQKELAKTGRMKELWLAGVQIVAGGILAWGAIAIASQDYSKYAENAFLGGSKAAEAAQIAGLPMSARDLALVRPEETGKGSPDVLGPTGDRVTAASALSAHYDAEAAFYGGYVLMLYAGAAGSVLILANGLRLWIKNDGLPFG